MKKPTRNKAIRNGIITLEDEDIINYTEFKAAKKEERQHRSFVGAKYTCPIDVAAGGLVLGHLARIVAAVDAGTYNAAKGLLGNVAVSCAYRTWARATRFAKPGERSSCELAIRAVLIDCGEWLTDKGKPGFCYEERVFKKDEK